ncbi:MAG TPA: hypothetical protein VF737_05165 [Gemmatimonadaceae bacterium]
MVARSLFRVVLVASTMSATTTTAAAQTGVRQSGSATVAVGVGSGAATFNCAACLSQRQLSVAAKIRAGMTLTSAWTAGLEGNLWTKRFQRPNGHSAAQLAFADLAAQWYPAGGSEFFVSAGAGVALFHETISNNGSAAFTVSSLSPALVLGLGWDLPVGDRWAVTPYVDFLTGGASSAIPDGTGARQRFQPALVQIGLAVTRLPPWRDAAAAWGLPRARRPTAARRVRSASTTATP